ncbi:secreted protein [Candidatus Magnetobacterium bavaricum]|uniref:Secreted protein n=1 Tax=Candidatus Magnetobacterium bavaricum TaxID=29290 RepID=A0A0F3H154_9BACT|nr:secreted protein [Candidatus Magnetobacterium bavaricum]
MSASPPMRTFMASATVATSTPNSAALSLSITTRTSGLPSSKEVSTSTIPGSFENLPDISLV